MTTKAKIKELRTLKANMRRFVLIRNVDSTGNSGTGPVAVGMQFPNGSIAMTWLSHLGTYVFYNTIEIVKALHGHNGDTAVTWLDKEENKETTLAEDLK